MGNPIDDNIVDNTVGTVTPAIMRSTLHAITRDILTGNRTYYVSTTGNDGADGTTSATAWATLQHAALFIAEKLDLAGFSVTVQIANGTYVGFGMASYIGGGIITFQGNLADQTQVVIQNGPNDGTYNLGECLCVFFAPLGSTALNINFLTLHVTASGSGQKKCVDVFADWSDVNFNNVNWTADAGSGCAILCENGARSTLFFNGSMTIVGTGLSAQAFFSMNTYGKMFDGAAWTCTGTPNTYATAFFDATEGTYESFGASYTGTAIGLHYALTGNSSVTGGEVAGSLGENFFPGNALGQVDGSSTYDNFCGAYAGSGLPTTANFPIPSTGGLYKDISGGGVYMVYNDGGSIRKVQLT